MLQTAADCGELAGPDITATLAVMDDLDELARAWGDWDIRWTGGEWYAVPSGTGKTVIAGTAAGLWLALWEARDALRGAA